MNLLKPFAEATIRGIDLSLAAVRVAIAGLEWSATRLAPPAPPVELDPEPNLLAHTLGPGIARSLASPALRVAIAVFPVPVVIGVRSGALEASVRASRGRIRVTNGVSPAALTVVDAELDLLTEGFGDFLAAELYDHQVAGDRERGW